MKHKYLFATIIFLIAVPTFAVETRYMQGLRDTHYQLLESGITDRELHVYVSLPDDYANSEKSYPKVTVALIALLKGGH